MIVRRKGALRPLSSLSPCLSDSLRKGLSAVSALFPDVGKESVFLQETTSPAAAEEDISSSFTN